MFIPIALDYVNSECDVRLYGLSHLCIDCSLQGSLEKCIATFTLSGEQCPGIFMGAISRCPCVFPSPTSYLLMIFGSLYEIGVYSINSSKMMGNFPEVLNFNWLFLKLNQFICNEQPVLPVHWWKLDTLFMK